MKSVSAAMAAHLAGPVTTLATCWRIVRTDGAAFHFTDHDRDLLFEGDTYVARSGYSRTAIASDAGMAVDNLDVESHLGTTAARVSEFLFLSLTAGSAYVLLKHGSNGWRKGNAS